MQKRIMAIHDISGFGRCSLTVCLPILSAAGINCTVLPTAVLSTHTGGLGNFTYRDLTSDIINIANHWKDLNIEFDAMYSGFLGSEQQVDILMEVFNMFKKEGNIILVDPVMADNGALYKTFNKNFPKKMAELCMAADIITPNITEAGLLTQMPYNPGPYSKEEIDSMLFKLADIFGNEKKYVITGVFFNKNEIGAAAYQNGKTHYFFNNLTPQFYPGTGDIFASVLISAILNKADLFEAADVAASFTASCAKRTYESGQDARYGTMFEPELSKLANLKFK